MGRILPSKSDVPVGEAHTNYRSASNVGRPLIKVVTPWNIANDLLRNLMIKTIIDYL